MIILDTYAMLAYLGREPGGERVSEILEEANKGQTTLAISLINLGEMLYIIERERGTLAARGALAVIHQLPIQILEVDYDQVLAAAHIKANYRVSYADAFGIAAAQACGGTILTGDPEFRSVENLVEIEWLAGSAR